MAEILIPTEFSALFAFCTRNGYSLTSCIAQDPKPKVISKPVRARYESVFKIRIPLILSDIAAFQRRDGETGPAVRRLFKEAINKTLSIDTLRWLDSKGYNLNWLIFGTGEMLEDSYTPVHFHNPDGTLTSIDCEQVRLMRLRTQNWSGLDWSWLHGNRFMRKRDIAPSMAIIARAVVCWQIPPLVPATPAVHSVCAKVQAMAESLLSQLRPGKDWRHYVLKRLQNTPARTGMLIGLTPVATNAYLAHLTSPTDCASKAFLVLDHILSRYGEQGLLDLLDMLNEDAIDRGYEDLGEVFKKRTWTAYSSSKQNDGEKGKDSEEGGEEALCQFDILRSKLDGFAGLQGGEEDNIEEYADDGDCDDGNCGCFEQAKTSKKPK